MPDSARPPTTPTGIFKRAVLALTLMAVWAFLLWGFYGFAGVEYGRHDFGRWLGIAVTVGVALAGLKLWSQLFAGDPAPPARPASAADGRRRWTAENDRMALKLHHEGQPDRAIGKRLGRTTTTVRTRLDTLQAAHADAAAHRDDREPAARP
ncbi:hypothetical protein [Catellatospora sichuanensis]|uniref:hypothetical protein n=1 Tax=Catellatospora sichuanensis TaxID=1969805 RepID=UPI001184258C|nr:hypothetical protein [Catellatospora sichuanensis]